MRGLDAHLCVYVLQGAWPIGTVSHHIHDGCNILYILACCLEAAERIDIGLGAGDQRVRIGAMAVDDARAVRQANGHFGLRVRPLGYTVHLIKFKFCFVRQHHFDGFEHGVHRAAAFGCDGLTLAVYDQR